MVPDIYRAKTLCMDGKAQRCVMQGPNTLLEMSFACRMLTAILCIASLRCSSFCNVAHTCLDTDMSLFGKVTNVRGYMDELADAPLPPTHTHKSPFSLIAPGGIIIKPTIFAYRRGSHKDLSSFTQSARWSAVSAHRYTVQSFTFVCVICTASDGKRGVNALHY